MDTTLRRKRILASTAAFTLVELLVVITIIGILAALITVAAVGALKTAQKVRIKAEINEISTAVDDYKNKATAYPPNCQTDGTGAANPLDEAGILNDVKRHIRQLAPRSQESDDLAKVLTGQAPVDTTYRVLPSGMAAGEAVVFWLGGFSADPKFPVSGEGGPSYSVVGIAAADRRKSDPIETRKWIFPFDVSRLGPRTSDGYFDETNGRYIEYRDPKGVLRRINFWQYTPAKSEQPYLYFDTSRHPAAVLSGSSVTGPYDPPAATASNIALHVHAFKKASDSVTATVPIQFMNPDKFQVIHCGIDGAWDTDAFERMSAHGVAAGGGDPTKVSDYLLFPSGPFVGDIADTEVNFAVETTIEDAQK